MEIKKYIIHQHKNYQQPANGEEDDNIQCGWENSNQFKCWKWLAESIKKVLWEDGQAVSSVYINSHWVRTKDTPIKRQGFVMTQQNGTQIVMHMIMNWINDDHIYT